MEAWADFLEAWPQFRGDGTLLDNCLVFGHSDVSLASSRITGIPMIAGGGEVL
jgi:hypothetical protein